MVYNAEEEESTGSVGQNLQNLTDSIKKDIAISERNKQGLNSKADINSIGKADDGKTLKNILLTFYSIFPGIVSGIIIAYVTMLVASTAFFYDIENLFYPGMFILLLATCFATVPIALLSQFPGISASISSTNAVLMGLFIFSLLTENKISYDVTTHDYIQISLSMGAVGLSVAVMFFLVGVMRISRIFAFAPEVIFATVQVVIAMMLIVIAYSLLSGEIVTSWPVLLESLSGGFFQYPQTRFALITGLVLALLTSFIKSPILLPILLVLIIIGFYFVMLVFLRTDMQSLVESGWLFSFDNVSIDVFAISKLGFMGISIFDWGVLREHLTDIIVICFVLLIVSLELNRRLEETVETYVHPAHEITATSFASVISAFISGFSVQNSYLPTVVAYRLGGRKRSAGLAAAATCGLIAVFGLPYIYIVPIPLVVAILFYTAMVALIKWLIKGIRNLDFIEYVLVVSALLVTIFLGHNAGLIFGLLSGAVVFMVTHSQISGIKRVLSGKLYHSSTERLTQTVKLLDTYGDTILIIQLEATLVYGMMYEIIHLIVGRNNDTRYNPLGYILLDFSGVRNIDVTVLDQMNGLFDVAENHDILIVICGLHKKHADIFKRIGFLRLRRNLTVKIMPTLDISVEWCEDDLLRTIGRIDDQIVEFNFENWLTERLGDEEMYLQLLPYLQEEILAENENLSQQYAQTNKLYFIKSGSIDVTLDMPNEEKLHLRKLKEGSIIGELGFYLGVKRNVNITALEETSLMTLDRATLVKIATNEAPLMLALHRFIVIYLSSRISYTRRMLQVVLASDTVK